MLVSVQKVFWVFIFTFALTRVVLRIPRSKLKERELKRKEVNINILFFFVFICWSWKHSDIQSGENSTMNSRVVIMQLKQSPT